MCFTISETLHTILAAWVKTCRMRERSNSTLNHLISFKAELQLVIKYLKDSTQITNYLTFVDFDDCNYKSGILSAHKGFYCQKNREMITDYKVTTNATTVNAS